MAEFFGEPQAAAVLKHGILRRYLPVFATKTGSVAGEVVYLDGYAGPGLYTDGTDGSPSLALKTAHAIAGYRGKASLTGHLIEKDKDSVDQLQALLKEAGVDWAVHHGKCEEHVPRILAALDVTTPVFAFIDPFGLPIPFEMLADLMRRAGRVGQYGREGGAATEVLLNFSLSGINRVGGQLTGAGTDPTWLRARATMVERMDNVLGGDWWQPIWRAGDPDRVDQIRLEYRRRLIEIAPGWSVYDVPVSDRLDGPPAYHLLFFTQHPHGVWAYNEAVSLASEEYRAHCRAAEGLLDLDAPADLKARWTNNVRENIERRMTKGAFVLQDALSDVYGDQLGEAREMHVRGALRELHADAKVKDDPKGVKRLSEYRVRPT